MLRLGLRILAALSRFGIERHAVSGSIATLDFESRTACPDDVSVIFCRLCKTFGKIGERIASERSKASLFVRKNRISENANRAHLTNVVVWMALQRKHVLVRNWG